MSQNMGKVQYSPRRASSQFTVHYSCTAVMISRIRVISCRRQPQRGSRGLGCGDLPLPSTAIMQADEAARCCDIAKVAMEQGDWDKALRLLNKSLRLCPNVRDCAAAWPPSCVPRQPPRPLTTDS
jgi:hypothetical protein